MWGVRLQGQSFNQRPTNPLYPFKGLNHVNDNAHSTVKRALPADSLPTPRLEGLKRKFDDSTNIWSDYSGKKPRRGRLGSVEQLQLLVQSTLEACRGCHPDIRSFDWYQHLEIRSASLSSFREQTIGPQLLDDPVINEPYDMPDLSDFDSNLRELIKDHFEQIEKQRRQVLAQIAFQAETLISPSVFVEEDGGYEKEPTMAGAVPPIGIEFVAAPFYIYSFLRTYAPHCKLSMKPDDDYTQALKVVTLLIAHMTDTYVDDYRSLEFTKILCHLFPNNTSYQWYSISKQESSIGLVYRRSEDKFPMLIVQVCEDSVDGGVLFSRNDRMYSELIESFKYIQKHCGAPVMFIQLAGNYNIILR